MLFTLAGLGLGYFIYSNIKRLSIFSGHISSYLGIVMQVIIVILFGIIFYFLAPKSLGFIEKIVKQLEIKLGSMPITEVVLSTVGLILGLLVANLASTPLKLIPVPYLGLTLTIIIYGVFGYLGLRLGSSNRDEINSRLKRYIELPKRHSKEKNNVNFTACPKILDTSVIIDGRVREIAKAGFLEGKLVVPVFVLEELQHIADSADGLKRARGRRGLDILKFMQDSPDFEIEIYEGKFPEIPEVDSKLLKLTQELKGKIVTNDFNLNKVASLQNIKVLNINQLANSIKPVFIPGEEMEIAIVKLGKEHDQGLGYLDDGTMIVVENGKDYLGTTIKVSVTSALQTSAGKMIFAKPL